jgi:dolichol-phosphate mannosyltransferase
MKNNISIVLPTLDEVDNITPLIEDIMAYFKDEIDKIYVVDDGSIDGTRKVVSLISTDNDKVVLLKRDSPDGLAGAIRDGVMTSTSTFVAWLDADGSMPISDLRNMWDSNFRTLNSALIGSRFIPGGSPKGGQLNFRELYKTLLNLRVSEDSFLAVVLSKIMNKFLKHLLKSKINDLTSGFILLPRNIIKPAYFSGHYGEYFPILISHLQRSGVLLYEFSYINLPRVHGKSKTGTTFFSLLNRGWPYITASIKHRIKLKF